MVEASVKAHWAISPITIVCEEQFSASPNRQINCMPRRCWQNFRDVVRASIMVIV